MKPLSFTTAAEDDGTTLAAALRKRLHGSWEDVRRKIRGGKVRVGGERVLDPTRRLHAGLEVAFDPAARRVREPSPVRIVHEDADVVVIDKPAGISSVPFEKRETGTAMDLIRMAWRAAGKKNATAQPLMVVHRIDKETSGLLVYAKNKPAERALARQFREHTVDRTYLCVVHGEMKSRRIESLLVRDRGDGLRGTARHPSQAGKRAVTHVEALEHFGEVTLCRVRLETGKTHQIRIHLSEAGHPLLGEKVYIRDFLRRGGTPLPSPRLLLHAATLGFFHPRTDQRLEFSSELPEDFRSALAALR